MDNMKGSQYYLIKKKTEWGINPLYYLMNTDDNPDHDEFLKQNEGLHRKYKYSPLKLANKVD